MDENRQARRTWGMFPIRLKAIVGCWCWMGTLWVALFFAGGALVAAETDEAFDGAARLYEQGKFREAATAYQQLVARGVATVSVLFNQGNAWLKAGEKGRAISCYRQAQKLAPRDPEIGSNLEWARAKVGSSGAPRQGTLDRFLALLTPNEWAVAAILGVWVWFGVVMVRELAPRLGWLSPGACWGLAACVAFLMTLAFAAKAASGRQNAVVIASEATVRFGPLEEAQTAFTLSDGAELVVTDRKGAWLEVRDGTGRRGWVASRHLAIIP